MTRTQKNHAFLKLSSKLNFILARCWTPHLTCQGILKLKAAAIISLRLISLAIMFLCKDY